MKILLEKIHCNSIEASKLLKKEGIVKPNTGSLGASKTS
jgi:hypothetical protein